MPGPQMSMLRLSGINKDLLPGLVPADQYTDGRNVFFRNKKSKRAPGYQTFSDDGRLFDADLVLYVESGPLRYWIYACARSGGNIGIGLTDGITHYDVTPPGWAEIVADGFILTAGTINNIPFINHPELAAYFWGYDTAQPFELLPGWPDNWTCRAMRSHKDFLMAINLQTEIGQLESQVSWSNSAEAGSVPTEWLPTPENDAGDATFPQVTGPLFDGISVRDQFFVAKRGFCGVLQYIGGQFVFQDRDVFPSMGLFATNAWCEHGNLIYMLTGEANFISTDGTAQADVLDGKLAQFLKTQINYAHPEAVFVYHDQGENQVILAYPTGLYDSCVEGISVCTMTGDCGIRDLPQARSVSVGTVGQLAVSWDSDDQPWDEDTTTWDQGASGYIGPVPIFGSGAVGMLQPNTGAITWINNAWQPLQAYLWRTGIDFTGYAGHATVTAMYPRIEGVSGTVLNFRFGMQDDDNGPLDLDPPQAFVIGLDDHLDTNFAGKLLAVQVTSTGGGAWQLSGLQPEGRQSGRWGGQKSAAPGRNR